MVVLDQHISSWRVITVKPLLLAGRGRHEVIIGLSMERDKEERARAI